MQPTIRLLVIDAKGVDAETIRRLGDLAASLLTGDGEAPARQTPPPADVPAGGDDPCGRQERGTEAPESAAPANSDGGPDDRSFDTTAARPAAADAPATDPTPSPTQTPTLADSPASDPADDAEWVDLEDAAKALGVPLNTLYNRRSRLGAGGPDSRRVPSDRRGPPKVQIRRSQLHLLEPRRQPEAEPPAESAPAQASPRQPHVTRPRFADGPLNSCQIPSFTAGPDDSRGIAARDLDDRPLLADDGEGDESAALTHEPRDRERRRRKGADQ